MNYIDGRYSGCSARAGGLPLGFPELVGDEQIAVEQVSYCAPGTVLSTWGRGGAESRPAPGSCTVPAEA